MTTVLFYIECGLFGVLLSANDIHVMERPFLFLWLAAVNSVVMTVVMKWITGA